MAAYRAEWFTLDWNAQRLAVLDRDVEAIIRTHARDRKVAAWLQDTAEALAEIGEFDLAIDWVRQALEVGSGSVAEGRRVLVRIACRPPSGRAARGAAGGVPALAPHPAPPRACIATRARHGRSTGMRSCSGSRPARVMRCCSCCCRSRARSYSANDWTSWPSAARGFCMTAASRAHGPTSTTSPSARLVCSSSMPSATRAGRP